MLLDVYPHELPHCSAFRYFRVDVPSWLLTAQEEAALLALVTRRRLVMEAAEQLAQLGADAAQTAPAASTSAATVHADETTHMPASHTAAPAAPAWTLAEQQQPGAQTLLQLAARFGVAPREVAKWMSDGERAIQLLTKYNLRCVVLLIEELACTSMNHCALVREAVLGYRVHQQVHVAMLLHIVQLPLNAVHCNNVPAWPGTYCRPRQLSAAAPTCPQTHPASCRASGKHPRCPSPIQWLCDVSLLDSLTRSCHLSPPPGRMPRQQASPCQTSWQPPSPASTQPSSASGPAPRGAA